MQLLALTDVVVEGHVHAAGGLDGFDGEVDHLSGTGRFRVVVVRGEERGVLGAAARKDAAVSIEAEDERGTFEGAEHQGQAAVGEQVRGGLVAAAGEVEIDDGVRIEDAKRGAIAGREVDSAFGGGGGVEEDVLPFDELAVNGLDGDELFAHGDSLGPLARLQSLNGGPAMVSGMLL